jgi:cytochrome c
MRRIAKAQCNNSRDNMPRSVRTLNCRRRRTLACVNRQRHGSVHNRREQNPRRRMLCHGDNHSWSEAMKRSAIATIVAAGLMMTGYAYAQDGAALAQKSGCMSCHAVDTKKMGPSFKDASAKLKGKSDADAVAAIKAVKQHASSKASDADLAGIAKWIQSL